MSEQAPGPQDTPAVAGPEQGPGETPQQPPYGDPSDPLQQRYDNLRSWTDRSIQEWSQRTRELEAEREQLQAEREQYEQIAQLQALYFDETADLDTRQQAADLLGWERPEGEPQQPDDQEDPYEAMLARQEALEQRYEEDQTAQQQAEDEAYMGEILQQQLDALDPELSPEEGDYILFRAIYGGIPQLKQPPDSPFATLPDVRSAYEAVKADEAQRMRKWAESKKAPHVSAVGHPATEAPNLDDRQERVDYMVSRLQANEQQ